jgi:DNA repair exonuclease SbcCD ATPase subunit
LVQENGRLAQSDAAHELKVKALSQDVERLEVTTVWEFALGFTNAIDARRWESNSYSISRIGKSEAMTKKCCIKVCSSITATKTRSIVYCCHSKRSTLTRWQKKDQSIASLTDQKAALSKQLEESSKVSKELDEERASMNQLKEQHSLELAKQKTKLEDACKHYQNTLKDEQGKLQLKEEELGAANSEISRLKSEVAAKTGAVDAQKALIVELQQAVGKREVTTVWEVAFGIH